MPKFEDSVFIMSPGEKTQEFFNKLNQQGGNYRSSAKKVITTQGIAKYRELAEKFYAMFYEPPREDVNLSTQKISRPVSSDAHEIELTFYQPKQLTDTKKPVLIYFPGGAAVLDLKQAYDKPCSEMAARGNCVVVKVGCRLSPEYTRFDTLADAYFAMNYLYENTDDLGLDQNRIAIGGNSSGAHIAALLTNRLRSEEIKLKFQLLITPSVDMSLVLRKQPEYMEYQQQDIMLSFEDQAYFTEISLTGYQHRQDPAISPYYDDLSNLPKTAVIYGEYDGIRSDAEGYVKKLKAAGNDVIVHCLPGQVHASMLCYKILSDGPYQASIAGDELAKVFSLSERLD